MASSSAASPTSSRMSLPCLMRSSSTADAAQATRHAGFEACSTWLSFNGAGTGRALWEDQDLAGGGPTSGEVVEALRRPVPADPAVDQSFDAVRHGADPC